MCKYCGVDNKRCFDGILKNDLTNVSRAGPKQLSLQESAGVFRNLQEFAGEYRSVQEYAGVHRIP